MKKNALQSMVAAIFLLHLLTAASATAAEASPTTGGLSRDDNGNVVADAGRKERLFLLSRATAMATNTFFHVHQEPATEGPIVNFSGMKKMPKSRSNPSHS
uniref:Dirigent protein n=1 Tax=Leersia perrieri TaxID=77586 RepID=A0A0D9XNN0_9ORYZ